jgi:phosphatidylinositol alpha-mannosyltransferase
MIDRKLKIGMVCPYGWDTPGGVQMHIKELAEYLIRDGHEVSVIAPVSDDEAIHESWLVNAGRPVPIPFNGSVARVLFGPVAALRVRQWIDQADFDVLHMHEPGIPSLSLLACFAAEGPMVGTFHASTSRLRALAAAGPLIEPMIEKLKARIAVSEMAQATMKNLYGTDAVVIPNGIDFARFSGVRTVEVTENLTHPTIGFLGRFEEARKGLPLLIDALPKILKVHPDLELVVAGPGDPGKILAKMDPRFARNIRFLGRITEEEKVSFLSSLNIYIAPNTGGESFGIIVAEAMAAGAAVVASDIPAFTALLNNGVHGELFKSEDVDSLSTSIIRLLASPTHMSEIAQSGLSAAIRFDWKTVSSQIMDVYEMAMAGHGKVGLGADNAIWKRERNR